MPSRSYDLDSPEFTADPYTTYAAMRRDDPVYRHEASAAAVGGPETVYSTGVSWYITRYEDSKAVLKDFKSFVHDFRLALTEEELARIPPAPPLMAVLGSNLTAVEPPEHTKLRALVSLAFARKQVQEMADLVQQITDELIDGIESRGEMELMADFASPLPMRVITGILGLPFEDAPMLRGWTVKPPEGEKDIAQVIANLSAAKDYIDRQLEMRRAQPTEDLITALMTAEIEGEKLEEIQLFSMIMMVVVAGFETTVNLIGNGMIAFLDHPAEMEKLRSNPALAENAVEEILRYDSPLEHSLTRWVAEDLEFRGQNLRRGDRIVVVQASANHDPEKFPNPDRFDIERGNPQHLSFGHGIHFCLGAPLARVEAPIAFKSLLARLPGLRLAVPREQVNYSPNLPFRGLASLPVRWDP